MSKCAYKFSQFPVRLVSRMSGKTTFTNRQTVCFSYHDSRCNASRIKFTLTGRVVTLVFTRLRISQPISSVIVRPENCSVRLTPPCTTGERTNRTNELALNWIILRKVTRLKNLRTNPCVDFTSFNYEVQCKCRSPMRGTRKKKKRKSRTETVRSHC